MVIISTNTKTLSIRAEGHANYSAKGQDIVCAAVSILLYAYAAELLRIGGGSEILDSGETFEIHPAGDDEEIMIAYETVMGGLKLLADEYENNVCIKECNSEPASLTGQNL